MGMWDCQESFYGDHDESRDGKCHWCGRRVGSGTPRQHSHFYQKSEIDLAYNYYYDPDFGSDRKDVY